MKNSTPAHTLVSGDEFFSPEFFPYAVVSLMRRGGKLVYFYDDSDGESQRMYLFIKNRVWTKTLCVEENYEEAFSSFLNDVDFLFIPYTDEGYLPILFDGIIEHEMEDINVVSNGNIPFFSSVVNNKPMSDILGKRNIRLTVLGHLPDKELSELDFPDTFIHSRVSRFQKNIPEAE